MTDVWIGLDVGTTAIKAAAYDRTGLMLGFADMASEVVRLPGGGNEQDPELVWSATTTCISKLTERLDGHRVVSIGLCAQGDGFWPLASDGSPVRNAILWNDTRPGAVKDFKSLAESGATDAVGLGCHTSLWPGTSALGWRWLRTHEPEAAAKVSKIVTCGDWIGARLTGKVATDFSNASIPFLDFGERAYGAAVDALDCADALPRLVPPSPAVSVLGGVTEAAAQSTGLEPGLPVSVATLDLGSMIVGMGMFDPGDIMMILGTTAVVNILTEIPMPRRDPIGATVLHSTKPDVAIRVLAPSTGAAAFDWFTSLHPQTLGGSSAGEIAEKLNAIVAKVPVGANGVTFLPYLNGERAPFVAPDIRAGFLGISSATSKAELGRAVMEGTALSLRHCLESESGLPDRPVQLTGGGSNNRIWCQIIADVMGQDILVNPKSDLGLWGAACIGASAAGFGEVSELTRRKNDFVRFAPDPENHAAYDQVFRRYRKLSDLLRSATLEGSQSWET